MGKDEHLTRFASSEIRAKVSDRDTLWAIVEALPINEGEKSRGIFCLKVTVSYPGGVEEQAVIVTRGRRTQHALQILTSGRYAIAPESTVGITGR